MWQGSSLHTGKVVLVRTRLGWSSPRRVSTSAPRRAPAPCSLDRPGSAHLRTGHPTPQGTGVMLGAPGPCQPSLGTCRARDVPRQRELRAAESPAGVPCATAAALPTFGKLGAGPVWARALQAELGCPILSRAPEQGRAVADTMGDAVEQTPLQLNLELAPARTRPGCCFPVPPAQGCRLPPPQPFPQREGRRAAVPRLSHRPAFPRRWLPEQPRELQAQYVTFSKSFSLPSLPPHRGQWQCWGAWEAPGVRAKATLGRASEPYTGHGSSQLSKGQLATEEPFKGDISQAVQARCAWPALFLLGLQHRRTLLPPAPHCPTSPSQLSWYHWEGGSAALTALPPPPPPPRHQTSLLAPFRPPSLGKISHNHLSPATPRPGASME